MAIYDCFQYFNEDHMVDLRMNILNEHVDFFVISESTKTHQGDDKKLNFNVSNFRKYAHKIIYLVADFDKENKNFKHTGGESKIEQHQRNNISKGLKKAEDNDLIILSDSDEIPDLKKLNQIKSNTKFTAFSQMMFMYKLNLQNLEESNWIGSKVCLKKYFPKPQKLRDLKFKNYPFWRIDKFDLQIIKGGWHFSFLQTPQDIVKKIKSYSHGEFNTNENTNEEKIKEKIKNNEDIFSRGYKLKEVSIDKSFPEYIYKNKQLLIDWII
jgi:beta-1,4-mannosyl-glycoprotein beta-1,4-N-acetylglucosaminyltransferase|tara:strand:- start:2310 stop:3113 length:804 start_codon:yes stop_codon:yes gene_type:complete